MNLLKFSSGNTKMKHLATVMGLKFSSVLAFDLPAGFSCPAARICATYANRKDGTRTKGKHMQFVCYASKAETQYVNTRNARWYNFDAILACKGDSQAMAKLILASIPARVEIIRIHASGDFFSPEYFQAWVKVAIARPDITFFAYTKMLPFLKISRPENFAVQYSYGGKHDAEFDAMPESDRPAACYVGQYEGQYPYRVVCNGHENGHEDFYAIMNGETFVIGKH